MEPKESPDPRLQLLVGLHDEIDLTEKTDGPKVFAIAFSAIGLAAVYLGGIPALGVAVPSWMAAAGCVGLEIRRRRRLLWLRESLTRAEQQAGTDD